MEYTDYIASKINDAAGCGFDPGPLDSYGMFPHQAELAAWAIKRGRAAIFAATGLGKTRMQLAFADQVAKHTAGPMLILAPLAVAAQTVAEGATIGVAVTHAHDGSDIRGGVNITNYDRLHRFDPSMFAGVVLDESSIIKHHDARTFTTLTESFAQTQYRLCATATPSPNDWTELGTHAEFLGVRSRSEMLSEFFVHDGGDTQTWRLKGHARHEFWRWVASWGALVQSPADLGHDDSAYRLPPLIVKQHTVGDAGPADGQLFAIEAQTLSERRGARRASLSLRVERCAEIINATDGPAIVWCDLNAEGDALRSAIPGSVEIRGSDDPDEKERRLIAFANRDIRVLITKPSIAGFGLNWQHCSTMAFVGVTDSFEAYYQAVRRCWRFGQKNAVNVHIFASEQEGSVIANLKRKERESDEMGRALAAETAAFVRSNVLGSTREHDSYLPTQRIVVPDFLKGSHASR